MSRLSLTAISVLCPQASDPLTGVQRLALSPEAALERKPSFKFELQRGLLDRTAPTGVLSPSRLRVGFASAR